MIRYALNMNVPQNEKTIHYKDVLVFSGSCFSEHIAKSLTELNFNVYSQPNGVVFNPLSIADAFNRVCSGHDYSENDLIHNNGLWHSKFHHGSFSETNKTDVLKKANHELHNLKKQLNVATRLFITFGSAYVYMLKESKEIVANCHKLPSSNFEKHILKTKDFVPNWITLLNQLDQLFPQLQIVFTVSPVKHLRDGVIENNLSKSTLLLGIQEIREKHAKTDYFPAFELVNDDLRDYRFYEQDAAHPNSLAIEYVLERFKESMMDVECKQYCIEMEKYLKLSRHRIQRADGEEYLHFMRQLETMRNDLQSKYGIEL